jgi:hypothetical protein
MCCKERRVEDGVDEETVIDALKWGDICLEETKVAVKISEVIADCWDPFHRFEVREWRLYILQDGVAGTGEKLGP